MQSVDVGVYVYFDNSERQPYRLCAISHNRVLRSMTPVNEPTYRRIVALDVARGIAILGTLATNIWIFATWHQMDSVMEQYFDPNFTLWDEVRAASTNGTAAEAADALFNAASALVTDGKFLGLLTIMFGIGMEIQRQSAAKRNQRWPGLYYWRAILLVIEGLLNYIFIFEFDVLMGYGLTALAVAPIIARSERVQKVWMWLALSAHVLVMLLFSVGTYLLNSIPLDEVEGGEDIPTFDQSFALYTATDSYPAMVQARIDDFFGGRFEIPIMFVMGIGVFLLAARLYRAGLFQPAGAGLRRKVMLVGLGVGIPLDWGLRLFTTGASASLTRYVTSTVVAFGVLALIAAFYIRRDNTLGVVGTGLAAVGRTALTCYILQNVLASVVFYDFGFGLARYVEGPAGTLLVCGVYLALCALLVAFSMLWLKRFQRGPFEIVMHRAVDMVATKQRQAVQR